MVRPPHELVLDMGADAGDEDTAQIRVTFEALATGTRMKFEVRGELDAAERGRMEQGWGVCFDKLGGHLVVPSSRRKA